FASSSSTSVGCSKHGYCDEFSAPVGSISSTNSPAGAVQPTTAPAVGTCGFSDANRLLVAVGTEVPEIMNWCAGKLGPDSSGTCGRQTCTSLPIGNTAPLPMD